MIVQSVIFRFRALPHFLKLHMPINICHLRYHEFFKKLFTFSYTYNLILVINQLNAQILVL
jgi:hypothetical protein